jgi:hypothetical protein
MYSKVIMDLFIASSTAQTEKFMLAEAVRTHIHNWLFTFAEKFCSYVSFYVIDPSEDGMDILINLINCTHPSLLRYHPIVANHTREDLRPLARSCLQRRLDGTQN